MALGDAFRGFSLLLVALLCFGIHQVCFLSGQQNQSTLMKQLVMKVTVPHQFIAPVGSNVPMISGAVVGISKPGSIVSNFTLGQIVECKSPQSWLVRPMMFELASTIIPGCQYSIVKMMPPTTDTADQTHLELQVGDYIHMHDARDDTDKFALVTSTSAQASEGQLGVRWQSALGSPVEMMHIWAPRYHLLPGNRTMLPAKQIAAPANSTKANPHEAPSAGLKSETKRFIILSLADKKYSELSQVTWKTVVKYAKRHGYATVRPEPPADQPWPIHFDKYAELLKLWDQGFHWLMWLDADVAITNTDVTLESIVAKHSQESTAIIIARDPYSLRRNEGHRWVPINTGVFLLRVCDWSKQLLQSALNIARMKSADYISFPKPRRFDPGGLQDQPIVTQLMDVQGQISPSPSAFAVLRCTEMHEHSSIVPGRVLNSFHKRPMYYDHPDSLWHPGDFILHVSGFPNQTMRIQLIHQVLRRASDQHERWLAPSNTASIPPEVSRIIDGFHHPLQNASLSRQQALLIGTAIDQHRKGGSPQVLVWASEALEPWITLGSRLNPNGTTSFLNKGTLHPIGSKSFGIKVYPATSMPLTSDKADTILNQAISHPCDTTCSMARRLLTVHLPNALQQAWDIIIINGGTGIESACQMIHTAATIALASPANHTTDIFLLHSDDRLLRRYSDAFLGHQNLYNTNVSPSHDANGCKGSSMMHWKLKGHGDLTKLSSVFHAAAPQNAAQRLDGSRLSTVHKSSTTFRVIKPLRI